jgi:hypothetical protein
MSAVVIPDPLRETHPPTERTLDQRRRRQGSALLERCFDVTPNGRRFGPRECLCEVHFEPVSGCRPTGRCVVGHGCTPLYRRDQQRKQSKEQRLSEPVWSRIRGDSLLTSSARRLLQGDYQRTGLTEGFDSQRLCASSASWLCTRGAVAVSQPHPSCGESSRPA